MKRRPSEARVCLFYSLSLFLFYRPINDSCICSYEAHLNIKEEFILGFFPKRVSPRKTLCLLFMLFTLLYIALTGYIHALGYTIYYSIKLKDIDIVWEL